MIKLPLTNWNSKSSGEKNHKIESNNGKALIIYSAIICFYTLLNSIVPAEIKEGKTINPVKDICWSCMFPMTFGNDKTTSKAGRLKIKSTPAVVVQDGRRLKIREVILSKGVR